MIHEGTHGIQGLDLLGRKVVMDGGQALELLAARIDGTITRAGHVQGLAEPASALARSLTHLGAATRPAWATQQPAEALANATPYLQAFGHVVIAWLWLDVALIAQRALEAEGGSPSATAAFCQGKLAAARYFHRYELPKTTAWLAVVESRDATCRDTRIDWF